MVFFWRTSTPCRFSLDVNPHFTQLPLTCRTHLRHDNLLCVADANVDLTAKKSDITTFRGAFESVMRAHYPTLVGHIHVKLVSCTSICTDGLSILSRSALYFQYCDFQKRKPLYCCKTLKYYFEIMMLYGYHIKVEASIKSSCDWTVWCEEQPHPAPRTFQTLVNMTFPYIKVLVVNYEMYSNLWMIYLANVTVKKYLSLYCLVICYSPKKQ